MGNTIEVQVKEDKPVLEVTETLVADFKNYISMADHSMAELARSIDAMRNSCEILIRQLDNDPQFQDLTTGTDSEKVNSQQLACRLLETINGSILGTKNVVIESLCNLFTFIWDAGKNCIDITENNPVVFQVEKYKSDQNSVCVVEGVSYTDFRIRSLEREKQNLLDKYTASQREITNLNKREDSYRKEIHILENDKKAQKQNIDTLSKKPSTLDKETSVGDFEGIAEESNTKEKIDRLNEEKNANNINVLTNEKETSMEDFDGLTKEINMKEDRQNQKLSVLTTYTCLYGYESDQWTNLLQSENDLKNNIYRALESEMAICNINFKILKWPSKIIGLPRDKVIIVPIKMQSHAKLQSMMQKAFEKLHLSPGPNIVILLLYDADRETVYEELNSPVGEEFQNLGGIFKFGQFTLKQPNTDMNDKNFKDFLQFLKSKC